MATVTELGSSPQATRSSLFALAVALGEVTVLNPETASRERA